ERRADLLIPVVKAWCTDLGVEIASTGVQVHGGMGYIEETGAAQYLRDARIAPIYEGTNGIQANDLVGRKLGRDQGEAARELFAEMRMSLADLAGKPEWEAMHRGLGHGLDAVEHATSYLVEADPALAAAGSSPYLPARGARPAGTAGVSDRAPCVLRDGRLEGRTGIRPRLIPSQAPVRARYFFQKPRIAASLARKFCDSASWPPIIMTPLSSSL